MEANIGKHFFSYKTNLESQNLRDSEFQRPLIMGILNLTPDSFFDGGSHNNTDDVLRHCEKMLTEGADIIDIGAFSSRPGMEVISKEEELTRLLPSLIMIKKEFPDAMISVDTFRKEVAQNAVDNGANIINDISGGIFDKEMLPYIGNNHIPYILMHSCNSIESLHHEIIENDICKEVRNFFEKQTATLSEYGASSIILDPGIGFNKSMKDNFNLLKNINEYRIKGLPVLIGISRKSMIYKTLKTTPQEALNGTTVLNTVAILNGADILRVHDVKEAVEIVTLVETMKNVE